MSVERAVFVASGDGVEYMGIEHVKMIEIDEDNQMIISTDSGQATKDLNVVGSIPWTNRLDELIVDGLIEEL